MTRIERTEPTGIITSYDPINRTMSILEPDRTKYTGKFNQSMIRYPLRVTLEIESFCRSNCKYCSEGKSISCRKNICTEKVKELIDELEEMKVHEVTIRGGEATEHPNFEEIWKYASAKKSIAINMISNGMSLTKDIVDRLVENPYSKIIVSLDGFKETNSNHRNPKQYDIVMSWLNKSAIAHPEQIVVLSCIYRQNYSEISKFAEYLAKQGIRHYHAAPLKRLGRSEMADENFVLLNEINALDTKLGLISEKHPGFKPVISCIAIDKYKTNKTDKIPVPLFNEIFYGSALKVTPEGEVMVNRGIMFTDKFKNEVNSQISLESLGNIYEKRLRDIWEESGKVRLEQEILANKHYAYYVGWLNTLN